MKDVFLHFRSNSSQLTSLLLGKCEMWPLVVLCALCVLSEHESPLLLSVFPPLHYLDTRYLMSFSRSTPALLATICSSVRWFVSALVCTGISRVQHCGVQHHNKGQKPRDLLSLVIRQKTWSVFIKRPTNIYIASAKLLDPPFSLWTHLVFCNSFTKCKRN